MTDRPPVPPPPRRARGYLRHPPGLELWIGVGLLLFYVGVAVSALFVFNGRLGTLSENPAWIPPFNPIPPSWAYPFGVMPGFGVNLFDAIWQATPWDLAIVFSILALDATIGALLGGLAGLNEGGWLDSVVTFFGDSLGAIPAVFLVVVFFAGVSAFYPQDAGLPLFVLLFGLLLWPTIARTVRDRVRTLAHQPYVEASRASGAGTPRLLFRHLLPNSLSPVLAQIPVDVAAIFFVLAVFPWFFNCNGPWPPPGTFYPVPALPPFSPLPGVAFPEWGYLLGFGTCEAFLFPGGPLYWWMFLFPLLAIVGLGVALALACDGLDRWLRLSS